MQINSNLRQLDYLEQLPILTKIGKTIDSFYLEELNCTIHPDESLEVKIVTRDLKTIKKIINVFAKINRTQNV